MVPGVQNFLLAYPPIICTGILAKVGASKSKTWRKMDI